MDALIKEINEIFGKVKLCDLTMNDEHAMLRTASTIINRALKDGKIAYAPAFYLDSNKDGYIVIKLGEYKEH